MVVDCTQGLSRSWKSVGMGTRRQRSKQQQQKSIGRKGNLDVITYTRSDVQRRRLLLFSDGICFVSAAHGGRRSRSRIEPPGKLLLTFTDRRFSLKEPVGCWPLALALTASEQKGRPRPASGSLFSVLRACDPALIEHVFLFEEASNTYCLLTFERPAN